MRASAVVGGFFSVLATLTLFVHGLFIMWVIVGAFVARSRPLLRGLHIASLIWGVLITEILPWPCPLLCWKTGSNRGPAPHQDGFLMHYLDNLVDPDGPARLLTIAGVIVCVLNLAFYGRLMWSESQANGNERVDEVQKP